MKKMEKNNRIPMKWQRIIAAYIGEDYGRFVRSGDIVQFDRGTSYGDVCGTNLSTGESFRIFLDSLRMPLWKFEEVILKGE